MYHYSEDDDIERAQRLGRRIAVQNGIEPDDGAQDGVVALLEMIRRGRRTDNRALAHRMFDPGGHVGERPLLHRSRSEDHATLPEWAQ